MPPEDGLAEGVELDELVMSETTCPLEAKRDASDALTETKGPEGLTVSVNPS